MKKLLILLLAAFMIFFTLGCDGGTISNDGKQVKKTLGTNEMKEVQLTDTEQMMFQQNYCFTYEFNGDSSYKNIKLWVDKYEFGQYAGNPIGTLSSDIKGKGKIVFLLENLNSNIPECAYLLRLGIKGNNGVSSASFIQPQEGWEKEGMICVWKHNYDEVVPIKDKMTLTSICYKKGNSASTFSDEFYANPEAHLDEIKSYDVVYLLRCEFEKDKKN